MSASGGGADWNAVIKLVGKLRVTPLPEHALPIVDELDGVVKRAESDLALETDIRNLVQEIAQATKQEVGQLMALGQMIPIDNVITLVRELHAIAVQYCATDSEVEALTRTFHGVFKRNTDNVSK
jgi:hypothetical protein